MSLLRQRESPMLVVGHDPGSGGGNRHMREGLFAFFPLLPSFSPHPHWPSHPSLHLSILQSTRSFNCALPLSLSPCPAEKARPNPVGSLVFCLELIERRLCPLSSSLLSSSLLLSSLHFLPSFATSLSPVFCLVVIKRSCGSCISFHTRQLKKPSLHLHSLFPFTCQESCHCSDSKVASLPIGPFRRLIPVQL